MRPGSQDPRSEVGEVWEARTEKDEAKCFLEASRLSLPDEQGSQGPSGRWVSCRRWAWLFTRGHLTASGSR